jgi:soluble lytic murein transglycosylase
MTLFGLALHLFISCINAEGEPPSPPPSEPIEVESSSKTQWIFWPESYFDVGLPFDNDLISLLATGEYTEALINLEEFDKSTFSSEQLTKFNVILAWSYLRSEQGEKAVQYLSSVLAYKEIPEDYYHLMIGEIRLEQEKYGAALESLNIVPETSPLYTQAKYKAATISKENNNLSEYKEILTKLSKEQDPFDNGEKVLYELADVIGKSSTNSYPYLRRLWMYYPNTSQAKSAVKYLSAFEKQSPKYKPTAEEWSLRAVQLMNGWQFKQIIKELAPHVSNWKTYTPGTCKAKYAYGRSHFKINSVTKAAQILEPVGDNCVGIDDDSGPRSLYITGKSFERKKMWSDAARAFGKIPKLYPNHSMADDGYARSGIGWQESGNIEKAFQSWEKQVAEYPQGDLVGEGYWRLAWNSFKSGNTEKAIAWAVEAKSVVPPVNQQYQYFAFYYWDARWRIWPFWDQPTKINENQIEVEKGLSMLKAMVEDHPTQFYTLLAAQRLYELDPDYMQKIKRTRYEVENGWWLPEKLIEDEVVTRASYLSHLGLYNTAYSELKKIEGYDSPSFIAVQAHIKGKGDWIASHNILHKYVQKYPPFTWEKNHGQIFSQTYPNKYWDLLQKVGSEHEFDLRIFHSLIREESSFNPNIKSWAGAQGLSQLMPGTAKRVAGWLGISINSKTVFDPEKNLMIGSRYLEYLRGYFNGNMFLAVAAYNAGEGNVGKWLKNRGNLPTDMYIESIPFRETRHYVKRVMGTYQAYHYQFDDGPVFYDFSAYNHKAKP